MSRITGLARPAQVPHEGVLRAEQRSEIKRRAIQGSKRRNKVEMDIE